MSLFVLCLRTALYVVRILLYAGLPDNYEHLLQMLSLCQQQQQQPQQIPSSNAYIHNQTPAKPVMAHHLPAGIMHSTSNASLYADSPTTPTQVLDATLALSANESYGSPTSSSFGSSPGSIPSVQITAAPTSPSYPLQVSRNDALPG